MSNDSRRYPVRPVLGVGALIIEGDKILLVERAGEPLAGYWSLPGGGVEAGETLEAAVRREILEETGLTVDNATFFEIFERIIPDKSGPDESGRPEYHYVLIDYLCQVSGIPKAGSDVSNVQWAGKQSLGDYHLTEGTLAVILRAFEHAAQRT